MDSWQVQNTVAGRRDGSYMQANSGFSINHYGNVDVGSGAHVQLGDQHYHFRGDSRNQEINRMLEQLTFPEIHNRFDSIVDAERGTFEWLLDPSVKPENFRDSKQQCLARFSQWHFHGTGTFWISGKPGSGKSTLVKHLLRKTSSLSASWHQVAQSSSFAYFFWLNGTPLQRSIAGCVRSLLCQLLQNEQTSQSAMSVLRSFMSSRYFWTDYRLQEAVCMILRQAQISVLLLLDGLDECEVPRDCLRFLDALENIPNLKICVSSRPEQIFVDEFENTSRIRLQDVNRDDISRMIEQNFLRDPNVQRIAVRQNNQQSLHDIASTIMAKAEGVFLWAHLVVKDVLEGVSSRDDLSDLQLRVKRMPGDMSLLYKSMLGRGSNTFTLHASQAALYFRLVLLDRKGHRRDHDLLAFAFMIDNHLRRRYLESITTPPYTRPTGAELDAGLIETWIHTRTSGLLQVTHYPYLWNSQDHFTRFKGSSVSFIHRTAADFLTNGEGQKLLEPCTLSEEEIVRIAFEAGVVQQIVVRNLQQQFVSLADVSDLFFFFNFNNILSYSLLHATCKDIWSELVRTGSIFLKHKFHRRYPHDFNLHQRATFPVSKYAAPDLVEMLASTGSFRCVEEWLDIHNGWHDIDYISCLLVPLLNNLAISVLLRKSAQWEGKVLWNKLVADGADLCRRLYDGYGDHFYPVFEALSVEFVDKRPLVPVLRLLSIDTRINHIMSSTSMLSCHEIWFESNPLEDHSMSASFYWGDFSIKDAATALNPIVSSYITGGSGGRIKIAIVGRPCGKLMLKTMFFVSEKDSERILGEMAKHEKFLQWKSDMIEALCFDSPHALDKIYPSDDCPVIRSFEAAMRILGKTPEMIRTFYEQEAVRMDKQDAKTKAGWEEWFWGTERPDDLTIGPILP